MKLLKWLGVVNGLENVTAALSGHVTSERRCEQRAAKPPAAGSSPVAIWLIVHRWAEKYQLAGPHTIANLSILRVLEQILPRHQAIAALRAFRRETAKLRSGHRRAIQIV